ELLNAFKKLIFSLLKSNSMSNVSKNLLVRGAKGKMGNQFVYKTRGNKTFIATLPTIRKNAVVTPKQQTVRELFGEASGYAKGAVANAELKAAYADKKAKGVTAFNRALRDYLKAPLVKEIDAGAYTGLAGSPIRITAVDDFRVASVSISIYSATGSLIEEGEASMNPINHNKWTYTAQQDISLLSGCMIRAIAKDLPENTGMLELLLP
ncbi:hypothetical protein, partial [Flavihumibacter sp. CACIAM 22H1]|uniref:hypothetical protein n=1 Tax=Flavihumibacter sp. CACIAM 22H1 TaxID=1812911 RepID=UPI0007A8E30E